MKLLQFSNIFLRIKNHELHRKLHYLLFMAEGCSKYNVLILLHSVIVKKQMKLCLQKNKDFHAGN